jgi:hypothetical protein
MRPSYVGFGIALLAFSPGAWPSTITTNPIPVTGSGNLLAEGGFRAVDISFSGINSEGDMVTVDQLDLSTECAFLGPMGGHCDFLLGGLTSPGPLLEVNGYFASFGQLAYDTAINSFQTTLGPFLETGPNVPTSITVPLASTFTFAPTTLFCANGPTFLPPDCGDGPPLGPCGSEFTNCSTNTLFTISPTPEPSTVVVVTLGTLYLVFKTKKALGFGLIVVHWMRSIPLSFGLAH